MNTNIEDHIKQSIEKIIEIRPQFNNSQENNFEGYVDSMLGLILAILSKNEAFQFDDLEDLLTPFMQKFECMPSGKLFEAYEELRLDPKKVWGYEPDDYYDMVRGALFQIEDIEERERLAAIINFDLNILGSPSNN